MPVPHERKLVIGLVSLYKNDGLSSNQVADVAKIVSAMEGVLGFGEADIFAKQIQSGQISSNYLGMLKGAIGRSGLPPESIEKYLEASSKHHGSSTEYELPSKDEDEVYALRHSLHEFLGGSYHESASSEEQQLAQWADTLLNHSAVKENELVYQLLNHDLSDFNVQLLENIAEAVEMPDQVRTTIIAKLEGRQSVSERIQDFENQTQSEQVEVQMPNDAGEEVYEPSRLYHADMQITFGLSKFFAQVEGHVKGSARIAEVLSDSFGWGEKRIFLEQLHNGKLTENYFNILQEAIYTSGVSNADDYNNISKNNMKDPSQYVAQKANPFYISMIKHSLHEYLGGSVFEAASAGEETIAQWVDELLNLDVSLENQLSYELLSNNLSEFNTNLLDKIADQADISDELKHKIKAKLGTDQPSIKDKIQSFEDLMASERVSGEVKRELGQLRDQNAGKVSEMRVKISGKFGVKPKRRKSELVKRMVQTLEHQNNQPAPPNSAIQKDPQELRTGRNKVRVKRTAKVLSSKLSFAQKRIVKANQGLVSERPRRQIDNDPGVRLKSAGQSPIGFVAPPIEKPSNEVSPTIVEPQELIKPLENEGPTDPGVRVESNEVIHLSAQEPPRPANGSGGGDPSGMSISQGGSGGGPIPSNESGGGLEISSGPIEPRPTEEINAQVTPDDFLPINMQDHAVQSAKSSSQFMKAIQSLETGVLGAQTDINLQTALLQFSGISGMNINEGGQQKITDKLTEKLQQLPKYSGKAQDIAAKWVSQLVENDHSTLSLASSRSPALSEAVSQNKVKIENNGYGQVTHLKTSITDDAGLAKTMMDTYLQNHTQTPPHINTGSDDMMRGVLKSLWEHDGPVDFKVVANDLSEKYQDVIELIKHKGEPGVDSNLQLFNGDQVDLSKAKEAVGELDVTSSKGNTLG